MALFVIAQVTDDPSRSIYQRVVLIHLCVAQDLPKLAPENESRREVEKVVRTTKLNLPSTMQLESLLIIVARSSITLRIYSIERCGFTTKRNPVVHVRLRQYFSTIQLRVTNQLRASLHV